MSPRRVGGLLLVFGLITVAFGCGPDQKSRAVVKGKVTVGAKHLTAGTVTFVTGDNRSGTATIDSNGNYVMNDAPIGDVSIFVTVPRTPPTMGGPKAGPAGKVKAPAMAGKGAPPGMDMGPPEMTTTVVPIPEKYSKPETSGLTYTVKSGEQTHDIALTP